MRHGVRVPPQSKITASMRSSRRPRSTRARCTVATRTSSSRRCRRTSRPARSAARPAPRPTRPPRRPRRGRCRGPGRRARRDVAAEPVGVHVHQRTPRPPEPAGARGRSRTSASHRPGAPRARGRCPRASTVLPAPSGPDRRPGHPRSQAAPSRSPSASVSAAVGSTSSPSTSAIRRPGARRAAPAAIAGPRGRPAAAARPAASFDRLRLLEHRHVPDAGQPHQLGVGQLRRDPSACANGIIRSASPPSTSTSQRRQRGQRG